jgi:hypothetical protein
MNGDKKLYGGKYETFAEWVKAEPDKFDDMDCRPGPGDSNEEYLRAVTPDHLRHLVPRIIEARRKQRESEAAQSLETARRLGADMDEEMFKRALGRSGKRSPRSRSASWLSVPRRCPRF